MFSSALLLAASAIAVPEFGHTTVDYLLRKVDFHRLDRGEKRVAVTLNLWVEPNRRIARCSLGRFAGDERTARSFCAHLLGMRTGLPRDGGGKRTYGFVSLEISAFNERRSTPPADLMAELFAQPVQGDADAELALPGASIAPDEHHEILVEVGADGTAKDCKKKSKEPDGVETEACRMALAKSYEVRYSMEGEPVSYVRNIRLVGRG